MNLTRFIWLNTLVAGSITRSDHVEKTTPQVVTDEGDGTDGVTGELREDTQVPPNSRVSMPRQDPLKGFLSVGDPNTSMISAYRADACGS